MKEYCKNCGHKIWFDDSLEYGGWHHSGMLHNDNCSCRKPEPKGEEMIKLSRAVQAVSEDTALNIILRSPEVQLELNRYKGVERTVNLPEILFNAYLKDVKTVSEHAGVEPPATVKYIIANKDRFKQLLREKFGSN